LEGNNFPKITLFFDKEIEEMLNSNEHLDLEHIIATINSCKKEVKPKIPKNIILGKQALLGKYVHDHGIIAFLTVQKPEDIGNMKDTLKEFLSVDIVQDIFILFAPEFFKYKG